MSIASYQLYDFDAAEQTWYEILTAAIPPPVQGLRSRMSNTNDTPRWEIVLQTQAIGTHKHILNPSQPLTQFQPDDVWQYQLTFAVSTNRADNGDQHAIIVAKGRQALQFYKLAQSWNNDVFTITDSKEQPLVKSVDDTGNIDVSTLTFTGMLCIRDGAWATATNV